MDQPNIRRKMPTLIPFLKPIPSELRIEKCEPNATLKFSKSDVDTFEGGKLVKTNGISINKIARIL